MPPKVSVERPEEDGRPFEFYDLIEAMPDKSYNRLTNCCIYQIQPIPGGLTLIPTWHNKKHTTYYWGSIYKDIGFLNSALRDEFQLFRGRIVLEQ